MNLNPQQRDAADDGDWVFSQCFGEKIPVSDLNDMDIISAVEFDQSGSFLATGDRGGRVVIFELDGHNSVRNIAAGVSKQRPALKRPVEFRFQSEFQSHEQEFDYLKSLEIEEKINQIRWCRPSNGALLLLSTNDKTVKLWKVHERVAATVCSFNAPGGERARRSWAPLQPLARPVARDPFGDVTMADARTHGGDKPGGYSRRGGDGDADDREEEVGKEQDFLPLHAASLPPRAAGPARADTSSGSGPGPASALPQLRLRMPRVDRGERTFVSSARRVFANAHAYHVNSVSVNSDGESFLSADDLRINLWNLDISDQSYNIVDMKPSNMEELAEVITAAEFHPHHCNLLMYSSSRGSIRLGDMRAHALCDVHAKSFEEPEPAGSKNFYSEIIASLSDVKFSRDGRYIVSRDYLSVKIWDLHMEARPVKTIRVHEHLRPRLAELYENECIFDKFEVVVSGDGNNLATGSYDNTFHIYDRYGKTDLSIEASKMPPKQQARLREQRRAHGRRGDDADLDDDADVDIDLGDADDAQRGTADAGGGLGRSPLAPRNHRQPGAPVDYSRKAMHLSWHPHYPLLAVAGLNNLYIYSQ